jgi:hypothetical protein
MLVILSLYMILYTTFIGISAAAMAENAATMSVYSGASPDASTIIATDGGFRYLTNVSANATTSIDVTRPTASYSWFSAFGNILMGSNTDIYSSSTFLTANMYIVRFLFWIPLMLLVIAIVFSILG